MRSWRIGLVGAGMVAAHHVRAWDTIDTARIVAIADPDIEAASARAHQGARVHETLTAMLEADDIDAIDIASPVETHAEIVSQAVNSGLPVLCQKPLAPTAELAQSLVAGLPDDARVMLHENWRWRKPCRLLKEHLAGTGMPRNFQMEVMSSGLLPDASGELPALQRQPFLAGLERLIVFELLGHHLDVLSYLFGPLEIHRAEIDRRCPAVRGEDFARIELRAGSCSGTLTGDFCRAGKPPFPTDRLLLDDRVVIDGWSITLPGLDWSTSAEEGYQMSYRDCIAHFLACLETGAPFETPIEHGVTLLQTVEEIYSMA